MGNSTKTSNGDCLRLLCEITDKDIWRKTNARLREFKPIFDGASWLIESKHLKKVERISQELGIRLVLWPMEGKTFEELRAANGYDLHLQRYIDNELEIDILKTKLGMEHMGNEEIFKDDKRDILQETPYGQRLIDCIMELVEEEFKHGRAN